MHRKYLLIVTALGEGGTGLALLVAPAFVFVLLLGVSSAAPETLVIARITGGAILAIGIICWQMHNHPGPAQSGVLAGVLIYDVAAAALLAHAGAVLSMTGLALWQAVALHGALGVWCVSCLGHNPADARLEK